MASEEAYLKHFQSQSMQVATRYLWGVCRRYFIFQYFLPFVLLESLPLLIMSFNTTVKYSLVANLVIDCLCVTILALGTGLNAIAEVNQYKKEGGKKYLRSKENYYQWLMIAVNIALILQVINALCHVGSGTGKELDYVINGMVLAIQLNVLEFFYRVRIFDFFAYFAR